MTAIVGMMNKGAVALAADSAVTMGSTHKVVNTGNKIFALSKYEPVAIAIYNCSSFLGTPWEVIIKMYRKQLKDKRFDYLEEYATDFFEYIHNMDFFSEESKRINYFFAFVDEIYESFLQFIEVENIINPTKENMMTFETALDEAIMTLDSNPSISPDFTDYPLEDFSNTFARYFELLRDNDKYGYITDNTIEKFRKFIYLNIIRNTIPSISSGIVFAGYGEKDIFPVICEFNVSIVVESRMKLHKLSTHRGDSSFVCPFAQKDVIKTVMEGMTPMFDDVIRDTIGQSVVKYNNALAQYLLDQYNTPEISDAVTKIDLNPIVGILIKELKEAMKKSYTEELMATISALDKTDLAKTAESLISLTCLVRRMQPYEETVGGPVDVLVISKGDGLIWMKRKHYFKPDLNSHFFSNYYRN